MSHHASESTGFDQRYQDEIRSLRQHYEVSLAHARELSHQQETGLAPDRYPEPGPIWPYNK